MLRNNIKSPSNYFWTLSSSDERLNILNGYFDQRILFVCLDYPEFLEQIDCFTGSDEDLLEDELNNFMVNILESKINIDLDNNEIIIPLVFKTYAADFSNSEE